MNLCSNHHILLWDIARQEDCYTMYISLSDFCQAAADCKKTEQGQPFWNDTGCLFIRKMRKRKVFALGFPCCLAFLIAMSQFQAGPIDFEGNVSITDDVCFWISWRRTAWITAWPKQGGYRSPGGGASGKFRYNYPDIGQDRGHPFYC